MPNSDSELQGFIDVALRASRRAEEVIMHYFGRDIVPEIKSDNSPVTVADKEAERVIIETIRSAFPDHGFLGEETGKSDNDSDYQWIIDPIDGTKNYIRAIPIFGSLIGLMRGDELIAGVSNTPAMNELIYAGKGIGAFAANGSPIKVSDIPALSEAQISLGGMDHFEKISKLDSMLGVIRSSYRVRSIGDAYAYHLVATGRFEAVIESQIRIWDIAAQAAIIEEAGGRVTDLQGAPITRESRTVIASNGHIHDAIVEHFRDNP
jgi:histidinol-phosphatase